MRINLTTPFAEKDQAKALGARWDPAKKVWYIQDVDNLEPFRRWLPKADASRPVVDVVPTPAGEDPFAGVADCGCKVLPWQDCVHTTNHR